MNCGYLNIVFLESSAEHLCIWPLETYFDGLGISNVEDVLSDLPPTVYKLIMGIDGSVIFGSLFSTTSLISAVFMRMFNLILFLSIFSFLLHHCLHS